LSKSGIGTSVGVKGFRVGVRPNGKSYVHAGRYGLYYRQELGGGESNKSPAAPEIEQSLTPHPDTIHYDSASSLELTSRSKKELLSRLNVSYTALRLDYLFGAIFLILVLISLSTSTALGAVSAFLGMVATVGMAIWESKRRTITITYEFEDGATSVFTQVISAFNALASSHNVWSLIASRSLYNFHESKLNAGADRLVNRSSVQVGEGSPPWVSTNIDVPALKTKNMALYLMPDGILVYDNKGVGFLEYNDVSVSDSITRFIEERPPVDATIVGRTWKYPNKKGGPDKRFKNNVEIAVCLYGELKITSKSGLFVYLMTSRQDSPSKFAQGFSNILKMIEASEASKQQQIGNPNRVLQGPGQDMKRNDVAHGDRPKRKISARAILADINDGIDSVELMQKYKLSSSELAIVYKKLDQAGMRKKS